MNKRDDFQRVLNTLISDDSSLKNLALSSGIDAFSFYQGADLAGLDLTGQDLTGLNFDRANLEGSSLESIIYDAGAFNGSYVDERYESKKDLYDFFIDDVFAAPRFGLYFFAKFRAATLEAAIRATNMYYSDFASLAEINPQTLRKARRGGVVAGDTATSICSALLDGWEAIGFDDLSTDGAAMRQPFIEFLDLNPKGEFEHISRQDYINVYRNQINLELKDGPLPVREYRSSFALDKWFITNAYLELDML